MKTFLLAPALSLIFAVALGAQSPAQFDFHWSFKFNTAKVQLNKKEYVEAQKAFEELAESASNPEDKSKAAIQIAIAVAHQDRFEDAMRIAASIPDASFVDNTRLQVMTIAGKNQEILEAFRETDFSLWPPELAYKGFLGRAEAFIQKEDLASAVKDLEAAVEAGSAENREMQTMQVETLNRIGSIYLSLDQPEKALAAFQRAVKICDETPLVRGRPGISGHAQAYPRAILSAARILSDKKEFAQAQDLLAKYDPADSKSSGLAALELSGDIYVEMGDKEKAVEKYSEGARMAKIYENIKAAEGFQKKIENLQN